ncbi:MAG: AAA family ATPase [Bacteroidales bacterium]|nr:AAA family ATPase [Bacteroidales bacterium]
MKLPNQIIARDSIDPKLAVGSSLPNPKGLFAIVFALYIVNDEKDHLEYSDKNGTGIKLKSSLIPLLKSFFSGINGYSDLEIESLETNNPLLEMQIEPLQVPLQLFWKIAKINIVGTDSSSGERTGGVRFPKKLFFTTNMDIVKSSISDENDSFTNNSKELIYSWLFNKSTSSSLQYIELKLIKTLTIFSEETLFKTWDNTTEIIFQQEGIYTSLDSTNPKVNIKGTKEIKGTLRNLKAVLDKNLHPFLKNNGDEVELINPANANIFGYYKNKVSNYLDLSPKSIEIKKIEKEEFVNSESISCLNKIFYGAPGTGKSHKVKELVAGKEERTERVTFHPEYDYNAFIGGYKPTMDGDNIRYKFVPQAFTNIYVKAWNDLENDYYLVIEEINRGNCAEIFGDIFQLLDRTNDYHITPSKELKEYLTTEFSGNLKIDGEKLILPPNLNILATMNTSDQSLFPMDSAFKRRWDWEYIPINYEASENNISSKFKVQLSEQESFSWLLFIKEVNSLIKSNDNLGMDKCLGNYFIKPTTDEIDVETFINKAIFYLWNDVFKDENEENNIFLNKTSYEDFFPIKPNGIEKVKEILNILKVEIAAE